MSTARNGILGIWWVPWFSLRCIFATPTRRMCFSLTQSPWYVRTRRDVYSRCEFLREMTQHIFFFSTIPKSCPHLIFYSEMCNFFKINCIFILRSIRQFSWQPPSHFCPVARLLLPIIYLFIYSSLILCFFNTFPYVLNKQDTHLYITIYMRKPQLYWWINYRSM